MAHESNIDLIERIRTVADAPRVFCVRRPIQVFGRKGGRAAMLEERPHLDVLIDRVTGTRSVLQRLTTGDQVEKWHEVAALESTCTLDAPLTCTLEQLPIITDAYSKVIYAFGGNQSGKTRIAGHWLFDRMLWRPGLYLWLAPTLEKTRVGVETLTETHEFSSQVIPPELIMSVPASERSGDQSIRLIDGTQVSLRFCSRKGDNIKGLTGVRAAVMDEGTSVPHEINYTIATNRLLMAAGQMLIPTTPVQGHWLQAKNLATATYAEIEQGIAAGRARPQAAKATLSCYDNPWIPEGEVDRTIESLGGKDDPRVKREVLGLWVAEGDPLWTHFDATKHLVTWANRDVERYGYVDITTLVGRDLFRGMTRATKFQWLLGQDYNFNPYSAVVAKFIVPVGADHSDPANWILYVEDVIVRKAKSTAEYADWLSTQAGAWHGRGMKQDAYAGQHVVGDGQGFYRNRDMRQNVSADSDEMKKAGYIVRAPMYRGAKKSPGNPPRDVRIGWLNDLFYRNRVLINASSMSDGVRCQDLIESLETEVQGKKASNTHADRISGVTDGLGYLAYAALFHRKEPVEDNPAPAITASGWT